MGLDKWIAPEKEKKKKKEESKINSQGLSNFRKKERVKETPILTKHTLICPKAKCKYQKVIVKRILTEKDKVCPKCKGLMRIK